MRRNSTAVRNGSGWWVFRRAGGSRVTPWRGPRGSRPDFFAPIYGASPHLAASADAPPVFLAAAADDEWGAEGALALFKTWRAAKRPAEIHIFQTGAHGFLNKGGGGDHVLDRLEEWM